MQEIAESEDAAEASRKRKLEEVSLPLEPQPNRCTSSSSNMPVQHDALALSRDPMTKLGYEYLAASTRTSAKSKGALAVLGASCLGALA